MTTTIDHAGLGQRLGQTRPAGLALLAAGMAAAELEQATDDRDLVAVALLLREAAALAATADAALLRRLARFADDNAAERQP